MSLGIGEINKGYSRVGAEDYKQELNTKAITETCALLRDIDGIRNALEKGWQGQAELNFMSNLQKAVTDTCEGIESLKEALDGEFDALEETWANQDNEMVPLE